MNLSDSQRIRLEQLADVLIPAGDGMPAASRAEVGRSGVDWVVRARPDLETPLRELLIASASHSPEDFVRRMAEHHPRWYGALTELVPAAYFYHEQVREALGYHGQGPRPLEAALSEEDESLLEAVRRRGPIYRPTPPEP
jgi:hypothetical protein